MKLIGSGVEGTAGLLGSLRLEPIYPLAVYLGLLELLGGTLLALGLLTPLVAMQVVGFIAVAAFYVHWPNGFLWV